MLHGMLWSVQQSAPRITIVLSTTSVSLSCDGKVNHVHHALSVGCLLLLEECICYIQLLQCSV